MKNGGMRVVEGFDPMDSTAGGIGVMFLCIALNICAWSFVSYMTNPPRGVGETQELRKLDLKAKNMSYMKWSKVSITLILFGTGIISQQYYKYILNIGS